MNVFDRKYKLVRTRKGPSKDVKPMSDIDVAAHLKALGLYSVEQLPRIPFEDEINTRGNDGISINT